MLTIMLLFKNNNQSIYIKYFYIYIIILLNTFIYSINNTIFNSFIIYNNVVNTSLINGVVLIHPILIYVTYIILIINFLFLFNFFFKFNFIILKFYKYSKLVLLCSFLALFLGGW